MTIDVLSRLSEFPTLVSSSVRLRRLGYKDIPIIARLVTAEVVRYLMDVPYPYKMVDAKRFIDKSRRNFKAKKELNFAIDSVSTRTLVGIISLHKIDQINNSGQISYWLGQNYWNIGIATESIRLVIRYAFNVLRLHKIYANVFDSNKASVRVLEKNHLRKEGGLIDSVFKQSKYHNILLYYRLNYR